MPLLFQVTVFFSLLVGVTYSYTENQICSSDTDCSSSTTEVYCRKTTYSPACQKGYCTCRSGYKFASGLAACVAIKSLGAACNSTNTNEFYPENAICTSSIVTCYTGAYYAASGSGCVSTATATFNAVCETPTTNLSRACNPAAGLTCLSGTSPKCICMNTAAYVYFSTSANFCLTRVYGDSCSQTADCDSGNYTQTGGAACSSSTCGCASGFSLVTRTDYNEIAGTTKTIKMCLKDSSSDIGFNKTCTMTPETTMSTSGAQVCSTSYVCARCPEDTTTALTGLCRSYQSTSQSGGAQSQIQTSFALLIAVLSVNTLLF